MNPSPAPDPGPDGSSLLSDEEWHALGRALRLSDRESQVVRAVFNDRKETVIARELGISAHTVHTHLERLYRKLGVGSRAGVVVRVFAEYLAQLRRGAGRPVPRAADV